jgi:glucose-6-phosphate 1-epimerase
VVSWTPAPGAAGAGGERLYLSARSDYRAGAAVRGGMPVIFPQFADSGPFARHGFARTRPWAAGHVARDAAGAAAAVLTLADDEATRALWPHAFRCTLTVRAAAGWLDVALTVENPGEEAFTFTGALHTYLAVGDVEAVRVRGLEGVAYRDKTRDKASGGAERGAEGRPLAPVGEVDRVYAGVPGAIDVDDAALGRRTRVTQAGFADAVVWSPGAAAGDALADVEPGGWRRFLCVEAGAVARPVTVTPGARWEGRQRFEAADV